MTELAGHPHQIREDMKAAVRLEKWNIFWTITYVATLGFAMGSSQAMKTAWVEDLLGLAPPIAFLVAERFERRGPNKRFQYGYDRANGLGFMIAAVALSAVGLYLLKDAVMALISGQHVTIGTVRLLGRDVWLGWFMLAAQAYACIPPYIIGRKELVLAERLRDKLIHTDAKMNKANWQTGIAGIIGVTGIGFGLWWMDAAAAIVIAASIIWDGWRALKVATSELTDGIPHELGDDSLAADAKGIAKALRARFPGSKILLRETGRFIRAEVIGAVPPEGFDPDSLDIEDLECRWRLDSVAFRPEFKK
ncbi:MAG: cation transporter [Croceibacterium sp.]